MLLSYILHTGLNHSLETSGSCCNCRKIPLHCVTLTIMCWLMMKDWSVKKDVWIWKICACWSLLPHHNLPRLPPFWHGIPTSLYTGLLVFTNHTECELLLKLIFMMVICTPWLFLSLFTCRSQHYWYQADQTESSSTWWAWPNYQFLAVDECTICILHINDILLFC